MIIGRELAPEPLLAARVKISVRRLTWRATSLEHPMAGDISTK